LLTGLSYRFGGHRGDVVLGVARFGPDQDAQGLSRRKGKNRQSSTVRDIGSVQKQGP